ncbi:hypothetical protein KCP77_22330 [Salmonella enterica subsp. enterica]|nr:hypothetical protein KCP77_22330 [Salmonella enterica subsp. enterica]
MHAAAQSQSHHAAGQPAAAVAECEKVRAMLLLPIASAYTLSNIRSGHGADRAADLLAHHDARQLAVIAAET